MQRAGDTIGQTWRRYLVPATLHVAIALTAYGHGREWIRNGAWATAESIVERFELEQFVEKLRSERIL